MFFMSRKFWRDSTERAVSTFFQAFMAFVGANAIGLTDVSWARVASVATMAALLSYAKSFAATTRGDRESASLIE